MKESGRSTEALPIPGVRLLWDVLGGDSEPGQKTAAPPHFRVEIDLVDHPILRWPIEDAHLLVTPTSTGTEAQVLAASWGGQPIRAEVLYQIAPEARLTVGLEAVDTPPEPVHLPASADASGPAPAPWGYGRFDLEPHATGDDEEAGIVSKLAGSFSLSGSDARFDDLEVALGDELSATAQLVLQLGSDERVGVDLSGRIVDASCGALGKRLGLPSDFITGTVDVFADIDGYLARDAHPLEHLEGTIHAAAEKGEIRKSVPLAVSLATATDGFNPFAKRESLRYDTIDAELVLRDGVLTGKRFELEGPVRVYATGNLDLIDDEIDAVVGVFLLQKFRELLGKLPLVNLVLPGSKHGFVGAYFQVDGDVNDPKVSMMAMKSLREELPDLIAKPFELIRWVWASEDDADESKSSRRAKKRAEAKARTGKPKAEPTPAPDEPAPEKAESSALAPAETMVR